MIALRTSLGSDASASLVIGAGAEVWPVAGALVTGFVFTPLLAGPTDVVPSVLPSSMPWEVPAACSARSDAFWVSAVAFWTMAPGLLCVLAPGSLAGTGVVAAGAARRARPRPSGLRKSM